jgi:CubicO group peptidase (beta-lactamase class C family)
MNRYLASFLAVLSLSVSAMAPAPGPASISALEKTVPSLMRRANVPGLSLALIRDGKIYWLKNFGTKDDTAPVTAETTFEAASLGKVVFAYAILKLADQGKLDLDAPLVRYLDAPYIDDPRLSAITARLVLSHRTGFPNWRPESQPLVIHFAPGDHFSYSGEGYVYLQKAVERIEGRPLDDVMRDLVFTPLGMTSSSYVWRADFDTSTAIGHDKTGAAKPKQKTKEAIAPASLQTTAGDYARFLVALLNGEGLSKEMLSQMETPATGVPLDCAVNCFDRPAALSPDISWGLGVGLEKTAQGLALWHWGDNGPFKAYMVAYPKARSGLVMFTNSQNGLSIANEIAKTALGSDQPAFTWLKNP